MRYKKQVKTGTLFPSVNCFCAILSTETNIHLQGSKTDIKRGVPLGMFAQGYTGLSLLALCECFLPSSHSSGLVLHLLCILNDALFKKQDKHICIQCIRQNSSALN